MVVRSDRYLIALPTILYVGAFRETHRGLEEFGDARLAANLMPPGGQLLRTLSGHSDGVRSVASSADGSVAVSGSLDKTVKVWDVNSP
ncbi:WD40 repeat domain-containing protein [Geitlerinema sp. PCC 9228]|uniref:WD40 repeat domain-containing protein n=1 Tax=Geitlerinema sp. PCC 9228 TaxID=111611 RepID=UPI0008F9DB6F|nr:WD40 repeat domain-containing protein [Geitlerinema sp. PCC 9228]